MPRSLCLSWLFSHTTEVILFVAFFRIKLHAFEKIKLEANKKLFGKTNRL